MPTLPELLPVLWEMGIFPNVQMFPKTSPEPIRNREAALIFYGNYFTLKPIQILTGA